MTSSTPTMRGRHCSRSFARVNCPSAHAKAIELVLVDEDIEAEKLQAAMLVNGGAQMGNSDGHSVAQSVLRPLLPW